MSLDPSKRPVVFGEVLFDRFPDGSVVLGGAPFNVAWHLQAFGQAPLFISRVGDDPLGRQVRDTMRDWGMDSDGLQLDSVHPTGTVEVRFEAGEPHYENVDQRAYDFVAADSLPSLQSAGLIYHGTLALRGQASRDAFNKLTEQLSAPRFLDVNLRAPWWSKDAVLSLIGTRTWLKLNGHELAALTPNGAASRPFHDQASDEWSCGC
jgi:fructokinase